MQLAEAIQDSARRAAIVAEAMVEVEAELGERGGVSGVAFRQGFKAVQKLRPQLFEQNIDVMLPRLAAVMDPHLEAATAQGDTHAYFLSNADSVAENLLAVTDERVAASNNRVANGIYEKLRGRAKSNVVDAMPRVGRFVVRHGA
jgi:hypothetical protein